MGDGVRVSLWRAVRSCVVVLTVLSGGTGLAWADCWRGTRQTTAGERAFQLETLKVIKAAMPAPPPGWRVVDETDVAPLRFACIGQELGPLELQYHIRFARVQGSGGPVSAASDSGSAGSAAGGAQIAIEVSVNADHQTLTPHSESLDVPGASLAFRGNAADSSSLAVMYGDWSFPADLDDPLRSQVVSHFVVDTPHTTVQSLSLSLKGDRGGVDACFQTLDLTALASLLDR